MKSKDTQTTVKSNKLGIMNGCALHLMFSSLRPIKKQSIPKDAA
jgi:hypothetical protein